MVDSDIPNWEKLEKVAKGRGLIAGVGGGGGGGGGGGTYVNKN